MLTYEIKITIYAGTGIVQSIVGPAEYMNNETVILGVLESAKQKAYEQIQKQNRMIVGKGKKDD